MKPEEHSVRYCIAGMHHGFRAEEMALSRSSAVVPHEACLAAAIWPDSGATVAAPAAETGIRPFAAAPAPCHDPSQRRLPEVSHAFAGDHHGFTHSLQGSQCRRQSGGISVPAGRQGQQLGPDRRWWRHAHGQPQPDRHQHAGKGEHGRDRPISYSTAQYATEEQAKGIATCCRRQWLFLWLPVGQFWKSAKAGWLPGY